MVSVNFSKKIKKALCKTESLLLYATQLDEHIFPGSSAVEQPAVNRLVAGSNPARGAILLQSCLAAFVFHRAIPTSFRLIA